MSSYSVFPTRRHCLRRLRRSLAATFLATLLTLAASPVFAKYASYVMDAETGRVIHEINADTRNFPASLTKMMTLYLVFEALKSDLWTMETELRVSARAERQPSSKLGIRRGETITVKQAMLALITKSANDVATAIAENLSGSESAFALKMTAKARQIGMSRTTFRNASGLPHRGQMSTARDMGTLARALIRDFPSYYRYFSTDQFSYEGATFNNHNKLLQTYDGVDGIKTGYIRASGFNLVASASRSGQRVIGVVFGGNSPNSRNALMTRLLNLGFKALNNSPRAVFAAAENPSKGNTKKARAMIQTMAKTVSNPKNQTDLEAPVPEGRRWGIQVGAFSRYEQAYEAAREALEIAPKLLLEAVIKVVPLKKRNGRTLHRARLKGLSKSQASSVCAVIIKRKGQCMEIQMRDDYRVASNTR
ncbi:MAG: D-alanyl-D-alanine carboxypeptidase [Proteobacteria bacterium]|nr:D-alanyl-D-alanine carboxypeptidase [Pseudomonadota bacterium]